MNSTETFEQAKTKRLGRYLDGRRTIKKIRQYQKGENIFENKINVNSIISNQKVEITLPTSMHCFFVS